MSRYGVNSDRVVSYMEHVLETDKVDIYYTDGTRQTVDLDEISNRLNRFASVGVQYIALDANQRQRVRYTNGDGGGGGEVEPPVEYIDFAFYGFQSYGGNASMQFYTYMDEIVLQNGNPRQVKKDIEYYPRLPRGAYGVVDVLQYVGENIVYAEYAKTVKYNYLPVFSADVTKIEIHTRAAYFYNKVAGSSPVFICFPENTYDDYLHKFSYLPDAGQAIVTKESAANINVKNMPANSSIKLYNGATLLQSIPTGGGNLDSAIFGDGLNWDRGEIVLTAAPAPTLNAVNYDYTGEGNSPNDGTLRVIKNGSNQVVFLNETGNGTFSTVVNDQLTVTLNAPTDHKGYLQILNTTTGAEIFLNVAVYGTVSHSFYPDPTKNYEINANVQPA